MLKIMMPLIALSIGLSACAKEEAQKNTDRTIDTATVTVREVSFTNNSGGRAVTRVRTNDAQASMTEWDFPGYHPEILVGQQATWEKHYFKGIEHVEGYDISFRSEVYYQRLCLSAVDRRLLCASTR